MIGVPNLRSFASNATNSSRGFQCHPDGEAEATVILSLGLMGVIANIIMMSLILINKHLRRWSQGLLFHQGAVDCGRAAILLPLGSSILHCEPIRKCSLVETAFLLLVTVSTINMLTTVLNDSPVFPEDGSDESLISGPLLMDSPQCALFGTFMIWFASITINLGPTFLSGALAARAEMIRNAPSCPLVHGPFRHYILNALWISINVICVMLTLFHLHKLHRDLTKANVEAVKVTGLVTTLVNVTGSNAPVRTAGAAVNANGGTAKVGGVRNAIEEHRRMRNYLLRMEREGIQKVKMFLVITTAYVIFWGPLFFVTLARPPIISSTGHEVTLHIAYLHAFVNPMLFITLHRGLRHAAFRLCCGFLYDWVASLFSRPVTPPSNHTHIPAAEESDFVVEVPQANLLVPPPPPPVHQPTVLAQHNTSITNSPYHQCFQDANSTHLNEDIEDTWDDINRPISKPSCNHTCHHHTPTNLPLYQHQSLADAEIQYSGYSSASE
ncbi:uncharacterized protein LOC135840062 isoform X2 [Planococcus citri]